MSHRRIRQIVIVTPWFPPEPTPFGQMVCELASHLAENGFDITVVTQLPSHPTGVLYQGYCKRLVQVDDEFKYRVLRVYTLTRGDGDRRPRGHLSRAFGFFLFTVLSWCVVAFRTRPQTIFAVLQPLSAGAVLPILARLKRSRLVFNIQDLHPDVLVNTGVLSNRLLIFLLRAIERYAYRSADLLTVICEAFRLHCTERGAASGAVRVIPNWIDLEEVQPISGPNRLRAELRLADDDFVVLYAGTIGLVSGAELVAKTAKALHDHKKLRFVFVGEGPVLPKLMDLARSYGLTNMLFVPFQPRSRLTEVQGLSDLSIVTLLPGHGASSVPSKVLGYMAAAKPIIASVDAECETANLVNAAKCGVIVPPQDVGALGNAILQLRDDRVLRERYGARGREYLKREHSKGSILRRYTELLGDVEET